MGGFTGVGRDGTARMLGDFAREGWINLIGGCCGTTPDWIAAFMARKSKTIEADGNRPKPPGWSYLQR